MRYVVLCVAVALAGCEKPPEEPPPHAEDACTVATPEESHVPQDEYNLAQIERAKKHSDPAEKDFALGRFRYGGKLADVIATHTPDLVLDHDGYTTALYAGGHPLGSLDNLYVIARKGKLVRAFFSTCIRHPIYFDGLSDEQKREWSAGYDAAFRAHFNLPPLPPPAPPAPPVGDGIPPPREAGTKP